VTLLSRRPRDGDSKGIRITTDLAELCRTRLLLVAVPSVSVRAAARDLGDHLDGSHVLVHGVRGLSGDELATISQILREETPVRRVGALGGPVQADELSDGRPSVLVVGSEFGEVRDAVRHALASEWLQVHATADRRGLEWASALVGCMAIGIGYAQAREDVSPGLLAALVARAVEEAVAIAVAAGADPHTLYGLGGYGDLVASILLPGRPEVVLGRELARGVSLGEARRRARLRVEAIELVPRIVRFAQAHGVRCEVFVALGAIIEGAVDPGSIVRALFAR
jgi:glycerol-3-phosphate dehydrogenase (NAD(P)+)